MSTRFAQLRRVGTAVVAPPVVVDESIRWRVVRLLELGGRKVMDVGERTYHPHRDVTVKAVKGSVVDAATVSLPLSHGFALSLSIAKTRLDGFGLFISRPSDAHGFSWEWFDRDGLVVFQKRQGNGRVTVDVTRGPGFEEIAAIEFLDEIVLRYLDDIRKPPGSFSHEIVIGKGSVFKFGR